MRNRANRLEIDAATVWSTSSEDTPDGAAGLVFPDMGPRAGGRSRSVRNGKGRGIAVGLIAAFVIACAGLALWILRPPMPVVIHLASGREKIALRADGRVDSIKPLAPGERVLLSEALSGKGIQFPADLDRFATPGHSQDDYAMMREPRGQYTGTATPVFQWQRVARASYRVTLLDEHGAEVEQSPWLGEPEWRLERPLAPGRLYGWRLTTRNDNGVATTLPPVDKPPLLFGVPDEPTLDSLATARVAHGDFPLLLALVLARAGVLDEAERALDFVVLENPGSNAALKLREAVRQRKSEL